MLKKKAVKKEKVCVVGVGYVGFPLAAVAAFRGYDVLAYDVNKKRLKKIERRENVFNEEFLVPIVPQIKIKTTSDPKKIKNCDIYIIAVPTPVDEKYFPDLQPIKKASETIAKNMKKGALVIMESTINPGVCENVVIPIFKKEGHVSGKDFHLIHCPERVNPGDPVWNVTNLPRVIGAMDKTGLAKGMKFYKNITSGQVLPMRSIREAEAVKIVENSFRDVNIAFVNELARSFDRMGIDVVDVIKGASTKPFAFMAHWPGCGVGGHCIPVDPYYMIERAKENDFDHAFLRRARAINSSMPYYTVEILQDTLDKIKKSLRGTKIGLLGVSYKANVGDWRESPSHKIIQILKNHNAEFEVFDPYAPEHSTVKSLDELLRKSEALILATNHRQFLDIPIKQFKKNKIKVIIDGRNCLNKDAIEKAGILYKGIGR
jgi:UDP-N-acetyl-D-glucosamine dehydrogenase